MKICGNKVIDLVKEEVGFEEYRLNYVNDICNEFWEEGSL